MAKITFYSRIGMYGDLDNFYNSTALTLERAKSNVVVYADADGGEKIKIEGSQLAVNKLGVITAGTITDVTFSASNTQPLLKLENASVDAKAFASVLKSGGVEAAYEFSLKGNDTFIGSLISDEIYGGAGKDTVKAGSGNDHIEGGKGNDILYGQAGSDHFVFHAGDGKDVIKDFDAVGGNLAQDYIDIDASMSYTIKSANGGADTLVDFGGGHTITLVGVISTQVTSADFQV
ncbi:calcium-binding protein [Rhizobium alvei]|uniref:Uncharacterized protein n=1 Tax=Rhizobium alvei TaxID=1132659 RepID=A0ABT8YGE0_9HYPH|nr:hypothetical protein [Rhizobium alvei]MDO6962735.1 hypothetical protein [Rhizobium alvei]